MSITVICYPQHTNNPLEQARRALIKALSEMPVPAPYGSFPEPEDHEAVKAHICSTVEQFDRWLEAIGEEIDCNTVGGIDRSPFKDQFISAVDGMATFVLDRAADDLREELAEARVS